MRPLPLLLLAGCASPLVVGPEPSRARDGEWTERTRLYEESEIGFGGVLAAGDVDGDGRVDLVAAAYGSLGGAGSGEIDVLPGGEVGEVDRRAATARIVGVGHYLGWSVAVVDVDHDGVADVLATDDDGNLRGLRGPIVGWRDASAADWVMHSYGELRVLGDVDGDGFADWVADGVVVTRPPPWRVDGPPPGMRLPTASDVHDAGDVDGDGHDDVTLETEAGVSILSGATLDPSAPIAWVPSGLGIAGIGDVDGDGRADVAVGPLHGTFYERDPGGTARIVTSPAGDLTEVGEVVGLPSWAGFAAGRPLGDADGDGTPDAVITERWARVYYGSSTSEASMESDLLSGAWWLHHGDGGGWTLEAFRDWPDADSALAVDLDGDGRREVVLAGVGPAGVVMAPPAR